MKSTITSVRLEEKENEYLKTMAKDARMTQSQFIRYLILNAKKNSTTRDIVRKAFMEDETWKFYLTRGLISQEDYDNWVSSKEKELEESPGERKQAVNVSTYVKSTSEDAPGTISLPFKVTPEQLARINAIRQSRGEPLYRQ